MALSLSITVFLLFPLIRRQVIVFHGGNDFIPDVVEFFIPAIAVVPPLLPRPLELRLAERGAPGVDLAGFADHVSFPRRVLRHVSLNFFNVRVDCFGSDGRWWCGFGRLNEPDLFSGWMNPD